MTHRVLLVAYYFPPLGGAPVARVMALVRHLPRHGWATVVLSPDNPGHPSRDEAAVHLVPADTLVVRTGIVEPGRVRRWLAARTDGGAQAETEAAQRSGLARRVLHHGAARSRRVLGSLGRLVLFPDEQIGWLPFGIVNGLRAIRRERVDAIWSTSSPISAHLIGGALAVIGRRPWVADFRDSWASAPSAFKRPRVHRWLMTRLEGWILRRADRVTFATPRLTKQYASRYPALSGRFATWLNGYDRAELEGLLAGWEAEHRQRPPGPFRLVYSGSLYRPMELETFLAGLSLAVERGSPRSDEIRIEFIGPADVECIALLNAWSRHAGRDAILHRRAFVPRAEALRSVAEADAALVLVGDGPGMDVFAPVKLYEAIGLDRPVLAMAPPGDLRDILEGLEWGVVVDPRPEAVAEGLGRLVASPRSSRRVDPDGRYDRARHVEELAKILDGAMGKRQGPARAGDERPPG